MGVLGVARGFGDYDLSGHCKIPIKPFVTCIPEVITFALSKVAEGSFVMMATDGLWDVLDNQEAVNGVLELESCFEENRKYLCAATCLVASARGFNNGRNYWYTKDKKPASMDDISMFVVPLYPYKLSLQKRIEACT